MLTVALARTRAPGVGGQQRYETRLAEHLRQLTGVHVRELSFGGVRDADADRRLPVGRLASAPAAVRAAVGSVVHPGGLVHRLDLRLPPARHEVVTVHDVAPLLFDDEGMLASSVAQELRRAAAVVAPSAFAASEVARAFGREDVHVVHNGVDLPPADVRPLTGADCLDIAGAERFVLHSGGATARKNLPALRAAWEALHRSHPDVALLLVGPAEAAKRALFDDVPGVRVHGHVDDALLHRLRSSATAVVVPSTYEGFGLPAVEAMAAGVPVVAAATSSLVEVCGDGAVLVPPDPAGLARGLAQVLDAGDLGSLLGRGRARSRRFSWDACARGHLALYEAAAAGHR